MTGWIEALITKVLGSEPLLKIFYSIVVFVLLTFFISDDYKLLIKEKTELAGLSTVFIYALAFIVTDIAHRMIRLVTPNISRFFDSSITKRETQKKVDQLKNSLAELTEEEKNILQGYIKSKYQYAYLVPGDIAVISLNSKGFIIQNNRKTSVNDNYKIVYQNYMPDEVYKMLLNNEALLAKK